MSLDFLKRVSPGMTNVLASKQTPMTCADAAAAAPFKMGDLVVLKSGGPAMTINYVDPEHAECLFFDGMKLCVEDFKHACLTKWPRPHDDEMPF